MRLKLTCFYSLVKDRFLSLRSKPLEGMALTIASPALELSSPLANCHC